MMTTWSAFASVGNNSRMNSRKRGTDRRQSRKMPDFPLRLSTSVLIEEDRRLNDERRQRGFISQQSFFSGVPYSTLEPLVALCDELDLKPGAVLIQAGEKNRHLYLLLDGRLTARIDKTDSERGFPIEPGECAGEISIVDGEPATANVVAEEPSRVLAIPEDILWQEFFKIPAIARNFMRLFARRFRDRNRAMQQALEQQLRWEHLQRELSIAQDIQEGMLPTGKSLGGRYPEVDIQARMTPAYEVGGDFFDTFPLDARRICVALGDVSGKGIPAALFMVRTMTLLREEMLRHRDLPTVVRNLNTKLCRDNARCMFATLIVGVLDVDIGSFSYINAGHNWPVFGSGGGNFDFLDSPGGVLIGVVEDAEYEVAVQQLARNDLLVLYSDGVTEARNRDRELFSDERLRSLLSFVEISDAEQTVRTVESAVHDFSAGCQQSDDLTVLVVRFCGR